MTEEEIAKAAQIVDSMHWQVAEGHNYRYRHATNTLIRFCESAMMSADVFRLVLDYLRRDVEIESVILNGKKIDLPGSWKAKDAWYQTHDGDHFEGTDQNRVRIFQSLVGKEEDSEADGPYTIEKGCQYRVTHTFYWDVEKMPEVGESESGVMRSLQGVTRDRETGLYSCVLEVKERVQQDIPLYKQAENTFEIVQEEQHLGVKQSNIDTTGKQAGVEVGVMTERRLSKNADCTTNIENVVRTEKNVPRAVQTARKTLRGVVKTTVDRNCTDPLEMSGLEVGEERRSELTPALLYDNTRTQATPEAGGVLTEACEKDAFTHVDRKLENVAVKPEDPEVDEASGGTIKRRTTRKTDEGNFDVEDETRQEIPEATAIKRIRKTLRGIVETVTDRNMAAPLDGNDMQVGEERQSELTPGRLYNNVQTKTTAAPVGKIAEDCRQAESVHVHTTTKNQMDPADPIERNPDANVEVETSDRLTEEGTHDVTERTTTYRKAGREIVGGTTDVTVELRSSINDEVQDAGEEPSPNVEIDVSISPNEHGTSSKTVRKTTHKPRTVKSAGGFATERVVTTTTVNDETNEASAEMGSASTSPNAHGTSTTQVSEYTPVPISSGWIEWESTNNTASGTYRYKHGFIVFINQSEVPKPDRGSNTDIRANINKFGLYDGTISYTDLIAWVQNSDEKGGVTTGAVTLYETRTDSTGKMFKREVTFDVIVYSGRGNEDAERADRARQIRYPGLHLEARTYAVGEPSYGPWEAAG